MSSGHQLSNKLIGSPFLTSTNNGWYLHCIAQWKHRNIIEAIKLKQKQNETMSYVCSRSTPCINNEQSVKYNKTDCLYPFISREKDVCLSDKDLISCNFTNKLHWKESSQKKKRVTNEIYMYFIIIFYYSIESENKIDKISLNLT